jgi:preprotein translocase subunit SecY
MIEVFKNIVKIEDLRNRILFTFAMLVVFRFGAHIPIPGIDGTALSEFFKSNSKGLLGNIDMFSGGAFRNMTIFALGIIPYITSSIVMQLLQAVFPYFERLAQEGEAGRKKIAQFTRYGTIFLSVVQGFAISTTLLSGGLSGNKLVLAGIDPWMFRFTTIITLTAGTAFVMWMGEQMTERGIGNGVSLIIFAGIVVGLPNALIRLIALFQTGELSIFVMLIVGVMMLACIGIVIYIETANRKVPIQYARRQQKNRVFGGQFTHLPLKINSANVIPPIFASSILVFPSTITSFASVEWLVRFGQSLTPGRMLYNILFVLLIFFFCFFYTAIQYNPNKIAEEIRRGGGFIPGIRPGKKTATYLNNVLQRLTFGGAIYLSLVCLVPTVLISYFNVPFYFGGTSLLILVGVAIDTNSQVETFLLNQNYDGFIQKSKRRKKRRF